MSENRVLLHQDDRAVFEDNLTWAEANALRILVTDDRRDALAQLLLARAEGLPTEAAEDRHLRAQQLDAKVMAMFLRLSEARG